MRMAFGSIFRIWGRESCWAYPLSFDVPNTTNSASWRFNEVEYRLLSHPTLLHLQAWPPLPCPLVPNENTPTRKPIGSLNKNNKNKKTAEIFHTMNLIGSFTNLQQTLWWLIAEQDEHHKLRFGNFTINSTTDGHNIEFNKERGA